MSRDRGRSRSRESKHDRRRYERSSEMNGRRRSSEKDRPNSRVNTMEHSSSEPSRRKSQDREYRGRGDVDEVSRKSAHDARSSDRLETRAAPSVSNAAAVWGNPCMEDSDPVKAVEVVAKANFGVTGALAKDKATGNVHNGVVLKWSEPQDAARPDRNWRIYVFQGDELVNTLHIHRQSAYLLGREEKVADLKLLHPTISKQHAVIQFRRIPTVVKPASDVDEAVVKKTVKPYIMDLDSTNKTFLNGTAVEGSRYIELKPKDLLKFGESSKEYVLICEQ